MNVFLDDYLPHYSPDGLTESDIDVLLAEVDAELVDTEPFLTTSVLDGTARAQRDRRMMQRQLGATVRVLRVHQPVAGQAGTEAA